MPLSLQAHIEEAEAPLGIGPEIMDRHGQLVVDVDHDSLDVALRDKPPVSQIDHLDAGSVELALVGAFSRGYLGT